MAQFTGRDAEAYRDRLLTSGGLTPEQAAIISATNNSAPGGIDSLDPQQLLQRYQTVAGGSADYKQFVNGIYGDQDRLNQFAYDSAKTTLGRDVTANELSQILPYFAGANGRQTGRAYLATLAEQQKNSPENLKKQFDEKAPQYAEKLDPVFDQYLNRDATASENDYFGQQLAAGRTQYEIEQDLRNSQEYQTGQDKTFRSGLNTELQGYDQSFFDKGKENILSRYAKQGGGVGTSSALDFAMTKLLGDISERRGQYLAGISSQQYAGNKDAAREDYRTSQGRYFQDQDYEKNRRAAELDYYRGRSDQNSDYSTQQNDYMNYLNSQRGGGGGPDVFGGALAGAGAGAPLGPYGAAGGALAGGLYSYLNRR